MTISILLGDVLKVSQCCYVPGQLGENIKYYEVASIAGAWTAYDVANQLNPIFQALYTPLLTSRAAYVGTVCQTVSQNTSVLDNVLSASQTDLTVTFVPATPDPTLLPGDEVIISKCNVLPYNGRYKVSAVTAATFSVILNNAGYPPATTGKWRKYITPPASQTVPAATPLAGTAGTTPIPTQVAGMVSFYCEDGGRKGRGRSYIPFPDQASNVAATDTPITAYVNNLDLFAAAVLGPNEISSGPNTLTLNGGLFDQYSPSIPVFRPFVTWISRRRWATQRKRGNYGRANANPFSNWP